MKLLSNAQIIFANVNKLLYSYTSIFHTVVRQQIWGRVPDFIPAYYTVHLKMQWGKMDFSSQKDRIGIGVYNSYSLVTLDAVSTSWVTIETCQKYVMLN